MSALEIIGAVTVGAFGLAVILIVLGLLREAVRATRQACRVARYLYGKHWRSKFRVAGFGRYFVKQVGHQFGGGEFRIRGIVFLADPSKPFRRGLSD